MKKLICGMIFFTLLIQLNSVFAGARGYRVVFIDLTPGQQFKPIFQKYRKITNMQSVSHCWDARKGDWIDIAYVKTQPINVAPETIRLSASGDGTSVKELARLLGSHRDDEITSGFDGAYFVTKEGGQYVVAGLSRDATFLKAPPVQVKSIKSLDRSLCAASAAFDKSFNP